MLLYVQEASFHLLAGEEQETSQNAGKKYIDWDPVGNGTATLH